ncbi:MAG: hypothetical protein AAF288_00760 [Planctomycetota bacterium]
MLDLRKTLVASGLCAAFTLTGAVLPGCEVFSSWTGGGSETQPAGAGQGVVGSITQVHSAAEDTLRELGVRITETRNIGVSAAVVGEARSGTNVSVFVYPSTAGRSEFLVSTDGPIDLALQAKIIDSILAKRGG